MIAEISGIWVVDEMLAAMRQRSHRFVLYSWLVIIIIIVAYSAYEALAMTHYDRDPAPTLTWWPVVFRHQSVESMNGVLFVPACEQSLT